MNEKPSCRYFMYYDANQLDAFMKCVDCDMDIIKLKETLTVCAEPVSKKLAAIPDSTPRFIKTHLPMSLLNPKLLDTAKVVYVARDPRDVAVSSYHCAKLYKVIRFPGGFKEFWNLFYKGLCKY